MAGRMAGARTIRHRPRRRRRAGAALVLLLAIVAAAAVALWLFVLQAGPSAEDDARRFLAAWSRGDDRGAAALTDRPDVAAESLAANRRGLDGASLRARLLDVREDGDGARARAELAWDVPGIGRFAYPVPLTLRRGDDRWTVTWSERVVHPKLEDDTQRLGTTREAARAGDIRDRDGVAIVRPRTVYRIGLARDEVTDVGVSVDALARVVDVDRRSLTQAVRGAGPQQFVEAIVLREADYEPVKDALKAVPGALAVHDQAPLAESRDFARALLGTVGPATAEQLERLGGSRAPGDEVGQSGLQARYEERLGGAATREVVIRAGGVPVETLLSREGKPGRPLRTTLSVDVQRAAEAALGRSPGRGLAGGRPAVDRRHPGRRQPARRTPRSTARSRAATRRAPPSRS